MQPTVGGLWWEYNTLMDVTKISYFLIPTTGTWQQMLEKLYDIYRTVFIDHFDKTTDNHEHFDILRYRNKCWYISSELTLLYFVRVNPEKKNLQQDYFIGSYIEFTIKLCAKLSPLTVAQYWHQTAWNTS